MILGLCFALCFIGIYFLLPLAFIKEDLTLMLGTFLVITIALAIGLCVVLANVYYLLSILLSRVLFFWENSSMK